MIVVEGKTVDEPLGVIQIAMQNAYASENYPTLRLCSLAAKFWHDGSVFLIEFNGETDPNAVKAKEYRRYRLMREDRPQHVPEQLGPKLSE